MNCKHCKKEIPANSVQIGGYHMDCGEEEVIVFKVRPESGMQWMIGEGHDWVKYTLEQMHPDDWNTLEVKCEYMTRIKVEQAPEHGGW